MFVAILSLYILSDSMTHGRKSGASLSPQAIIWTGTYINFTIKSKIFLLSYGNTVALAYPYM